MIFTKKFQQVFLATLLLAGLASCEKDLDTEPITNIQEEYIFDTPERILGQVNGLYDAVKAGSFLGSRYIVYGDIRGEEFINMRSNVVTGLQTWNHTVNSVTAEVENLWNFGYAAINKINIFLKKIDENASKVDPVLLPQYKAEAKFLRALCYYDLVVFYAKPYTLNQGASLGLPLRLDAELGVENNDLARSSVSAIYNQILKDLNDAEAGLPVKYSSALLNVTRAQVNTAIALKTRVYLSMGKYPEVVSEAKKMASATAPNSFMHKLEPNPATPFTNYTTAESIFSLPMTTNDPAGTQNQLAYYYSNLIAGAGEYSLNAKGIIADTTWRTVDTRRTSFVNPGTTSYLKKYNNDKFLDFVPIIRYAEVLLNYAEAAARTNDPNTAIELLKIVRNRADAQYVFPAASIDTEPELIKTILKERRIELLGEGLRVFDLLRLNEPLPAKGSATAIQPSQAQYIWPIPNSEMLTNKLMVPN